MPNITQKLLAAHCDRDTLYPGDLIQAKVDLVLGNDITTPLALREFFAAGFRRVFDPERIVLVQDHFVPSKDIKSAEQSMVVRQFAREYRITHHFDVGSAGIEHALLPEVGLVVSGDLVIGADSHTCTYGALGAFATGIGSTDMAAAMAIGEVWLRVPEVMKVVLTGKRSRWVSGKDIILAIIGKIGTDGARYMSMEFQGPLVADLSMDERMTISNMVIEAGAKAGIFQPDGVTMEYMNHRAKRAPRLYTSDADATYQAELVLDVTGMAPVVALPHSPDNVRQISELGEIPIDQVVIGSCTNGRYSDLEMAASVLRGKKVNPNVRLIVIPATQQVYLDAMRAGLLEVFIEAGGVISPPTCGPCLGGYMGILGPGERAVATTNRNFVGRMGHPKSEVVLASPFVAAASAVLGRVAAPWEVAS
ncbi:MAG: 3-isopropylmalate dehydratase large subunit [Bacillota bacterium]